MSERFWTKRFAKNLAITGLLAAVSGVAIGLHNNRYERIQAEDAAEIAMWDDIIESHTLGPERNVEREAIRLYFADQTNYQAPQVNSGSSVPEPSMERLENKIEIETGRSIGVAKGRTYRPGSVINDLYVEQTIALESSGNPNVPDSEDGARGLMQIMPETWSETTRYLYGKEISFEKASDPILNRDVGTKYLEVVESYLSTRIPGWENRSVEERQDLIAAAYNGGMGKLVKYKGNIDAMPEESRDHVRKLHKLRDQ